MQCVQCSVAVLRGGSLVHVPEALHGGDVPLDALLGEVELRHKRQRSTVVAAEQHGATVVALKTGSRVTTAFISPRGDTLVSVILTAATRLFSETKMTLRRGRKSVFNCEGLNGHKQISVFRTKYFAVLKKNK